MKNVIWILALSLVMAGCKGKGNQEESSAAFKTLIITKSNLQLSQDYPASIEGRQSIKIIPRIEGYLQNVHIKEGQRVKRGQTLFTIDQTPYRAEVTAAEANVAVAEANVAEAQLNYDSRQRLHNKDIVSDYELQSASARLKMAQAGLQQSKAQLETARNNLSYTVLKSPSDGIVGSLPYRVGDYVSPSMQRGLTYIADNSEMYVYFSLTERDAMNRMQEQGSFDKVVTAFPLVSLQLSNGEIYPLKGKVESISGIVESNTGALSARAVFTNPDGVLLSGSTGRLIVTEEHEQSIVIPQTATYEILNKIYVYKVVHGLAQSAIIEVAPTSDGLNYVVTRGLNEGDVIVAEGAGYVREGMKIDINKQAEQ